MKSNSFICVVALLSLAGCDDLRPMTNSQIIFETRFCESSGMDAAPIRNLSYRTVAIECRPKK